MGFLFCKHPYKEPSDHKALYGTEYIGNYPVLTIKQHGTAHEKAIKYLLEHQKSHILNLGTGTAVSVKQIVTATEEIIGKPLKYTYAARRLGDPAKLVASSSLAQQILGWQPKYTFIKDIIQTTWNMEK